jgi:hypothetical protein
MSSFVRRIQRMAPHMAWEYSKSAKQWVRTKRLGRNYLGSGIGSKLGVKNPKDAALLARRRREKKWGRV